MKVLVQADFQLILSTVWPDVPLHYCAQLGSSFGCLVSLCQPVSLRIGLTIGHVQLYWLSCAF